MGQGRRGGGLINISSLALLVLEAEESMVWVPADLVSVQGDLLPDSQMTVFPLCPQTWKEGLESCLNSPHTGTHPICEGSAL